MDDSQKSDHGMGIFNLTAMNKGKLQELGGRFDHGGKAGGL